jgi:hypothetical protein
MVGHRSEGISSAGVLQPNSFRRDSESIVLLQSSGLIREFKAQFSAGGRFRFGKFQMEVERKVLRRGDFFRRHSEAILWSIPRLWCFMSLKIS